MLLDGRECEGRAERCIVLAAIDRSMRKKDGRLSVMRASQALVVESEERRGKARPWAAGRAAGRDSEQRRKVVAEGFTEEEDNEVDEEREREVKRRRS
jgi:hypothetical protein